jgi:hypothetical protein
MCFQAAIGNRGNMLLLIPEAGIDINEKLEASVSSSVLAELGWYAGLAHSSTTHIVPNLEGTIARSNKALSSYDPRNYTASF